MRRYLDNLIPDPEKQVEEQIEDSIPSLIPEDPKDEEKIDAAEKILDDEYAIRRGTWTGDKYDARKNNEIEVTADMYDPEKDDAAQSFSDDYKKGLIYASSNLLV